MCPKKGMVIIMPDLSIYQNIMAENKSLRDENERLKEYVRRRCLENLIFDNLDDEISRGIIEQLGIDFNRNTYSLLLIFLKGKKRKLRSAEMFEAAEKTFSFALRGYPQKEFFYVPAGIACFLMLNDLTFSKPIAVNELAEKAQLAVNVFSETTDFPLHVAISVSSGDIGDMKRLYQEAVFIRDFSFDIEKDVVSDCDINWLDRQSEMKKITEKEQASQLERQFMNCLMEKKFYEAVSTLDTITNIMIWETRSTLDKILSSIHFRLEMALWISGIGFNSAAKEHPYLYNAIEKLMNAETFRQMREAVYDVFALMEDAYSSIEATKLKTCHIKKYIQEEFHNSALGSAAICEYFKLSPSYLSRIFKEEAGCGLVDYIHSVRLSEARHMLETTDFTLDIIAGRVGFSNHWTLIRAFKASEGTTPGLYRKAFKAMSV